MNHQVIIDRLGGPKSVAVMLGVNGMTPHKWGERGIPAAHWPAIARHAQKIGFILTVDQIAAAARPSVFRGATRSQPAAPAADLAAIAPAAKSAGISRPGGQAAPRSKSKRAR